MTNKMEILWNESLNAPLPKPITKDYFSILRDQLIPLVKHFKEEGNTDFDQWYDVIDTNEFYKKIMSIKSRSKKFIILKKYMKENTIYHKHYNFYEINGGNQLRELLLDIIHPNW